MKRTLGLILAVVLCAALLLPALASAAGTTYYVYTADGKTLNIRDYPSTEGKVVARYNFGDPVEVISFMGNGWAMVNYRSTVYYVSDRYLVKNPPNGKTIPVYKSGTEAQEKASEKTVEPFYIAARPSRPTGWVNFRQGPASSTKRIGTLGDGKELRVIAETTGWYKAEDPVTGKVGYLSKNYAEQIVRNITPVDGKTQMGTLNVNGKFNLQCKLPTGYQMSVVNEKGSSVVASITSADETRPVMYLSVAFDEIMANVERMNDLTDEAMKALEKTFTDMNEVEIEYRQTAYGTKLMVAREIGDDTDFVDILTVYKGYLIEFNMTPGPLAADQKLTENQIAQCVQFLSDLDFTPVN